MPTPCALNNDGSGIVPFACNCKHATTASIYLLPLLTAAVALRSGDELVAPARGDSVVDAVLADADADDDDAAAPCTT